MPGVTTVDKTPNHLPTASAAEPINMSSSVKRLRQNSHTTLHKLIRKATPLFRSPRLSTCLLRHPIFVLSILIALVISSAIFVFFQVFSPTFFHFPSLFNSHYSNDDVNDIQFIRSLDRSLNSSSIPEAPELVHIDINKPLAPLRIVLIVPPFDSSTSQSQSQSPDRYDHQKFLELLTSLRNADYRNHAVNLNILILPDENQPNSLVKTYSAVRSTLSWPHGRLTIRNSTSGGQLEALSIAWGPTRGISDAVALIDARRAKPLSSSWYRYVQSARVRYAHRADVIAFCVEPVRPRGEDAPLIPADDGASNDGGSDKAEEEMDSDVFMWEGVEDGGVIIPSSVDKWRAFLRWLQQQRPDWFMWPTVVGLRDKRDERWDHFRSTVRAPWQLWLSRFSALYSVYTMYPRKPNPGPLPIHRRGSNNMMVNSRIMRLKLDGSVVKHGADSRISDSSVHQIVELGRKHGGVVSLTVINQAFLETARSWICNVDVAGFRPPGIVWITTDDEAYNGLKNVEDSVALRVSEMRGAKHGTRFGSPGYWLLMLERTVLIRDILNHGIGVFAFETDQVWLRDPMPYVYRVVRGGGDDVDIVGTVDSSHDIAGNFLFLNPTLATRKLWTEVVKRFEHAYNAEKMDSQPATARIIIENDQTLLTHLTLFDELFRAKFPTVFRALDTELFVSGRWYDGGQRWYTSPKSRSPIMINNNFIEGIRRKTSRLKYHAHWFLNSDGSCEARRVRRAVEQNERRAERAGLISQKSTHGVSESAPRTDKGEVNKQARILVGVDSNANLEMAISALRSEREDDKTKLLLNHKRLDITQIKKPWAHEALWKWYSELVSTRSFAFTSSGSVTSSHHSSQNSKPSSLRQSHSHHHLMAKYHHKHRHGHHGHH